MSVIPPIFGKRARNVCVIWVMALDTLPSVAELTVVLELPLLSWIPWRVSVPPPGWRESG